jgi:hypothetical protein
VYRGQPFPKAEISWHNDLSFWSDRVRVGIGVNYVGGITQLNGGALRQCNSQRCRQLQDMRTSLADQAYAVASQGVAAGGSSTWGFLQRGSYARLNELSLTVYAPSQFTRALRAQSANISLMGRNLKLWSKYRSADPEVNTSTFGNQMVDDAGVPQPRDWSVRVNLNY